MSNTEGLQKMTGLYLFEQIHTSTIEVTQKYLDNGVPTVLGKMLPHLTTPTTDYKIYRVYKNWLVVKFKSPLTNLMIKAIITVLYYDTAVLKHLH